MPRIRIARITPIRELNTLILFKKKDKKIPKGIPGMVITFGIILYFISIKEIIIKAVIKSEYIKKFEVKPYFRKRATNIIPHKTSTNRYFIGIFSLQDRHFPLKIR